MALIALFLFTAALVAIGGVLRFTLLPAIPRMVALLRGAPQSAGFASPPVPIRRHAAEDRHLWGRRPLASMPLRIAA